MLSDLGRKGLISYGSIKSLTRRKLLGYKYALSFRLRFKVER